MQIRNAIQLKNSKKGKDEDRGFNSFTQPIQFLSRDEKDTDWAVHNLDWLEWQGVKQISNNARKLMKNYKLAKGTIDREDYIHDEGVPTDVSELVDILSRDSIQDSSSDSSFDLKFYPIIPNIINVLVAEFAKRNTKVDYRAVDEYSYNEILEAKMGDIEEALLEDAMGRLQSKMVDMGMDPNSPEAQEQFDPEALKKLPEIEDFYSKTYQTLGEQWAAKQHNVDTHRFRMDELEEIAFRDMLITDREFWHFRMMEDDYDIELWNPVLTFYHKSPEARYISEGSWIGKIDMLTVSDVIDKYGPILNQDQQEMIEGLHPVRSGRYLDNGIQNDGSYYNPGISHEANLDPSLQMKKWLSHTENSYNPDDIVSWIVGQSEHTGILQDDQMLRVTTAYWKTQRKIGYLTSVDEGGEVVVEIVDESYRVANKPLYHTLTSDQRTADNLVFGDHIDWIWTNQVYGGVKIGPNRMMFRDFGDMDEFAPIYIGVEGNEIGPMRYQFKGENSLYGCKLPVEGKVFTERNSKSTAMVDLLKPSQIGFNMANNQIADIMIDEIGTVVAIDQNALPKHSMGESWGKNNLAKAYTVMKDFSILPLDTTMANTENALNFQHYQTLNLEQSNRLRSRIDLANFFKQQALEVIGLTPQRLGQQIGQTDTATGVEQAVAGSYAQTEMYFIQHSDYLMPRVHQMRTDLAQYYHSKRPSIRMQNMISPDERKFFEINGTDLLMLDLNVFCTTNANTRAMMERVQQMAVQNNTSGASIYEIGGVMEADSLGSLNNILKKMDTDAQERAELEHQRNKEMQQGESDARQKELQMENDHDFKMLESKNRNNLMTAEIKAAGYGAQQDINQNMESDFKDSLDDLKQTEQYQESLNFDKTKEDNRTNLASRKLDIEEKKINMSKEVSDNQLRVARENRTKPEIDAKKNKTTKK
tara:strand:+ start:226 stop:3009 length:2784 start_codon:yes stop_codon:yes gene_type:complete